MSVVCISPEKHSACLQSGDVDVPPGIEAVEHERYGETCQDNGQALPVTRVTRIHGIDDVPAGAQRDIVQHHKGDDQDDRLCTISSEPP